MNVSEVARRAGVSPDSIRYYEDLGLIPPARRSPAGYREFGDETVRRIRFIKGAQGLGLRLAEIGELLKIQDDGACPCGHTKTLLERRLEQVNREIATLTGLREELERLSQLECFSDPTASTWDCEIELVRKGGEPVGDH